MNTLLRVVVALVAGFVTFVVAGVAATDLFFPRIEFSLFVGVPFGLWAAIAVAGMLYAGLWYRDASDPRPALVVGTFWTAVAVAAAFLVVSAVGFVWFFGLGGNIAVLLLIYVLPLAMFAAGILGALWTYLLAQEDRGAGRNGDGHGAPAQ